jgi:hypothetical protein
VCLPEDSWLDALMALNMLGLVNEERVLRRCNYFIGGDLGTNLTASYPTCFEPAGSDVSL